MKHECPCCHFFTLEGRGDYDICPVCFWEDDGQDDPHADDVIGGANYDLSLTAARKNYLSIGACGERYLQFVRPPKPNELAK